MRRPGFPVSVLVLLLGTSIPAWPHAELLKSAPAWPHAELLKSAPARRAVLRVAPSRIQLWVNERLEPDFARLSVWDATGTQVDTQDARVDSADPKRLSVGLPALPPGTYTVKFRVLSVDGHVVESQFTFRVRPGP